MYIETTKRRQVFLWKWLGILALLAGGYIVMQRFVISYLRLVLQPNLQILNQMNNIELYSYAAMAVSFLFSFRRLSVALSVVYTFVCLLA